jgi:hypothetical protein
MNAISAFDPSEKGISGSYFWTRETVDFVVPNLMRNVESPDHWSRTVELRRK